MKIRVPVKWEMTGCIEIEADSVKESLEFIKKNGKTLKMPTESEFVEGSIQLIFYDEEFVKLYN